MVKNLPADAGGAGDEGLIPGLENPTDRGAWWATVHGVAKRWTQLNTFSIQITQIFLAHILGNN